MKARFIAILLLCFATSALAHQIDEFLQATTIDVAKDHVTLDMRLTPGADVFRAAFIEMDTNGDGVVSEAEQHAYVERVRQRLSLTLDGHDLPLVTMSSTFPKVEEMKAGVGDILLTLRADGITSGSTHRLTFVNRHQRGIAAYLVNCLVPTDPDIRIVKQDRNYNQSEYVLDYTQSPRLAGRSHTEFENSHPVPAKYGNAIVVAMLVVTAIGLWIRSRRSPTSHLY